MALNGHVTSSGQQVQDGLSPPSVACGAVYTYGCTLPPDPAKYQGFRDTKGRLYFTRRGANKCPVGPGDHHLLEQDPDPRPRALLVGGAVSGATVAVSEKCPASALKAVSYRVFRQPKATPDPLVYRYLSTSVDWLIPGFCDPIETWEVPYWISSMPSNRRRPLTNAYLLYQLGGWSRHYRTFSAFLKSEKAAGYRVTDYGTLESAEYYLDRLIQGPHDVTHVIAGPKIKPLTQRLKDIWNWQSPIFYAAKSVEYLNNWFNSRYFDGMTAIMSDYSAFDNSHSDPSWDFIEGLYRRLGFFDDPDFVHVMNAWRAPRGTITGKDWVLQYIAYTMNASGRDDTALANALLNGLCFSLSVIAALCGCTIPQLTQSMVERYLPTLNLSVMGDDSLCLLDTALVTPSFLAAIESGIKSFGFSAKMVVSTNPFDFVYLGMRPYPANGRWWFGKTLGRALFKFGWKLDPTLGDGPAWFTGDCMAVSATSSITPIYWDLANSYLSTRVKCRVTRPPLDDNKPWTIGDPNCPNYTQQTVAYVADGYGLSYTEVVDCISYVRGLRNFPCVMDHPVLTRFLAVDDT